MTENKYDMEQMLDEMARSWVEKAASVSAHPPYDELTPMQKYQIKQPLMAGLNVFIPVAEAHMTEVIKAEVVAKLRESIEAAVAMGLRAEDAIAVF